jgi:hypothetical protein
LTFLNKKCYTSVYSNKFKEITMKKTLLLSVVASTMIMAGGDIAPVEPVVEAPAAVEEASAWKFGGQIVAYTQTVDASGNSSLFDDESTYAAWGAQLSAVNSDIVGGIGAGIEVSGTVSSENAGFYTGGGNAGLQSGGITQAYLTYGMGDTSVKVGRQTLPKGLSPFAYSEGWQMFKNTFDAALVVNTSIPDTALVYAYVLNANRSVGANLNEDSFQKVAAWAGLDAEGGVHMVTAQNKSIENLTLTGSYYLGVDHAGADIDNTMLWGDAAYNAGAFNVAIQGGSIDADTLPETTAFGAKIGAKVGMFNLMAAYSSVDEDGVLPVSNYGTGVKSPLYTQMVLNNVGQYHANPGSDFIKLGGSVKALGGTVKAFYGMGENDADATKGDYTELDLMYVTKLTENIKFFAAYVYTDDDMYSEATATGVRPSENNFVRFWARYSF